MPAGREQQFFRFMIASDIYSASEPFEHGSVFMHLFDAIIGLGSNIGNKRDNIARAIDVLTAGDGMRLVQRSRDYRSAPWGKTDQDWFVNACITVATKLPPHDVLQCCFEAERKLGRVRQERWGPRSLDCDLLVYRDVHINTPELTLPHPRITERAFVLVPLLEVAPRLVIDGSDIAKWLEKLDASDVTAIA